MTDKKRIALYIDAENIGASHAPAIMAKVQSLGKLTIARCYGNQAAQTNWATAVNTHALTPVLTPPAGTIKNASDFALIIDAVAHAHRGRFDAAVLASSDTAFALMARHFREYDIALHTVREAKAASALSTAFASKSIAQETPDNGLDRLLRELLDLVPSLATAHLGQIGEELRKRMGENYPKGKLSTHLKRHQNLFSVEGTTLRRLK